MYTVKKSILHTALRNVSFLRRATVSDSLPVSVRTVSIVLSVSNAWMKERYIVPYFQILARISPLPVANFSPCGLGATEMTEKAGTCQQPRRMFID